MEATDFTDTVAVITGAASGMGFLAAQRFIAGGAAVVLVDANVAAVTAAAASLPGDRALPVVADVRRYEEVEQVAAQALQRFGRIDYLLNFAGGAETRVLGLEGVPFHELPPEAIDWGLDVNLKGPVYLSRAILPTMIAQQRGVIINLGSVSGIEGAHAVCYSAAKSGLIGLTKSLALCGAPHGVRACCVSPGPVLTRPGMAAMRTRLGRAAEPREVVDLILYLCSDRAAFITGSNHVIDGGRGCGGPD